MTGIENQRQPAPRGKAGKESAKRLQGGFGAGDNLFVSTRQVTEIADSRIDGTVEVARKVLVAIVDKVATGGVNGPCSHDPLRRETRILQKGGGGGDRLRLDIEAQQLPPGLQVPGQKEAVMTVAGGQVEKAGAGSDNLGKEALPPGNNLSKSCRR